MRSALPPAKQIDCNLPSFHCVKSSTVLPLSAKVLPESRFPMAINTANKWGLNRFGPQPPGDLAKSLIWLWFLFRVSLLMQTFGHWNETGWKDANIHLNMIRLWKTKTTTTRKRKKETSFNFQHGSRFVLLVRFILVRQLFHELLRHGSTVAWNGQTACVTNFHMFENIVVSFKSCIQNSPELDWFHCLIKETVFPMTDLANQSDKDHM